MFRLQRIKNNGRKTSYKHGRAGVLCPFLMMFRNFQCYTYLLVGIPSQLTLYSFIYLLPLFIHRTAPTFDRQENSGRRNLLPRYHEEFYLIPGIPGIWRRDHRTEPLGEGIDSRTDQNNGGQVSQLAGKNLCLLTGPSDILIEN